MAKNSITDYDNTAANNTDVQSVDISEGCSPSGINNAIREVMADLADVNDGTVALTSPKFDSIKDGNIKPPDASGTDVAGTATTIKGGAGTGTGAGGSIVFQTADGGSTGSSVNAHATAMTITDDGSIDINGNELILDADADTSITADTDDQIDIKIGGSDVASFSANGLEMVNGKGIYFGATADGSGTTSSELFDDYEEGTFTPTVNSGTISNASARYRKIGTVCHVEMFFDSPSDITSGNGVNIGGLPFSVRATNTVATGSSMLSANVTNFGDFGGVYFNDPVKVVIYSATTGGGYDYLKHSDFTSTTNSAVFLGFSYITT